MNCRVFRQDTLYNPAEQRQVGQLSNRYIVISRLIRYERLFISRVARACVVQFVGTKSSLSNHFAHSFRVPEKITRIGTQPYATHRNVIISTASRDKSN